MEHMSAKSTSRLLKARILVGTLLPPLEQAAALRSTAIGKRLFGGSKVSDETLKAVMSILVALLRETLSSDVMQLSLSVARSMALAEGVSKREFDRVEKRVVKFWSDRRLQNPLASMFV